MNSAPSRDNNFKRTVKSIVRFFPSLVLDPGRRLVTLSAVLFCLAYPPLPFGFVAYFALVPLLMAVAGKGFKTGFGRGYLFGFMQSAVLLYWVGYGILSYVSSANLEGSPGIKFFLTWIATPGAPVALALIQALFMALMCGLYGWLSARGKYWIATFPILWTSVEYIRTMSEFAFPWVELAYTQSKLLPMIQTASWWGDLGVGFFIAVVNMLVYLAWVSRKKARTRAVLYGSGAGIILLFFLIHGLLSGYTADGSKVNVSLIQHNLTLEEKFSGNSLSLSRDRLTHMTMEAGQKADLVIFPETAVREFLLGGQTRLHWAHLARTLKTNILIGTFDRERREERNCDFNSAVQVDQNGNYEYVHHKLRLVPFSEKIPYIQHFPFLWDFHFGQSDFCMGDSITIFRMRKGDYAVMICFEVGFAELNRRAVDKGADFLVTITNDTWWGRSAGPYQHAYILPFRSVENRRWFARSANSGFSFFCDPYGRIHDRSELFEQTSVRGVIYTNEEMTFFTKHGMWLPKIIIILAGILILSRFTLGIVKRADA